MGLKYIYAGYSKCGTKTIAAAFRKLGFNVVDYEETMLDYRLRWNDYLHPGTTPAEKSKIVQKMYESVDIVFDVPHYFLWKELMDAFPDAKCIFWAREEDSWWNSFHKQLLSVKMHSIPEPIFNPIMFICFPTFYPSLMKFVKNFEGFFHGRHIENYVHWNGDQFHIDESRYRRLYRQHVADFLQNCPVDKRLVLDDINCGWEVLCKFIDCEVPDCDWPHANKNAAITYQLFQDPESRFQKELWGAGRKTLVIYGSVVLIVSALYLFCQML